MSDVNKPLFAGDLSTGPQAVQGFDGYQAICSQGRFAWIRDECCKYSFLNFDPLVCVRMLFVVILFFYESKLPQIFGADGLQF